MDEALREAISAHLGATWDEARAEYTGMGDDYEADAGRAVVRVNATHVALDKAMEDSAAQRARLLAVLRAASAWDLFDGGTLCPEEWEAATESLDAALAAALDACRAAGDGAEDTPS